MIKKYFYIIYNSTILFCIISFASLVLSALISKMNHSFPNLKIGFPFNYYYQIQINSDNGHELQHGTTKTHILYNLIFCIFTIILFLRYRKFKTTKNPTNP